MCHVTVRKKFLINRISADDIHVFAVIFFQFFQNFLKTTGILDELEAAGIQEGDTVRMYGLKFDYYK